MKDFKILNVTEKRLIVLVLVTVLFVFTACKNAIAKVEITAKPNIVWITSEDNSIHYMDLYTEYGSATPNIRKLAENGLLFSHAFSNAPVCSAARSTLISGIYGPRMASHYHREMKKVTMPENTKMFPSYLRDAGYYTTNNFKEDYNIIKENDVWDESSKNASWRNRAEGQPFFHVFNINTTHEGVLHFTKEDMKTPTKANPNDMFVSPKHPNTELFRYTVATYHDKIKSMDEELGSVVSELKKDGLMDNTFIFYFGDHGGVLPGSKGYVYEIGLQVPLVVYIPSKYQDKVSFKKGDKVDGFVSFVDFGATVLNLAGIPIPAGISGTPFLGSGISKEDVNSRDETFSYADRFDEKYDMVRAIRKGKYKYIRNFQPFNFDGLHNDYRYKQLAYQEWLQLYKDNKLNALQSKFFQTKPVEALYDVESDPYETKNLAELPEYKSVVGDLRSVLFSKMKNLPDLSLYPEFYLMNNSFGNPVQFGLDHKNDIADYLDIANLSLSAYSDIKDELKKKLESNDPWKRYWALIVSTAMCKDAADLLPIIMKISNNDDQLINRVRAAEFLGLSQLADPEPIILEALYASTDPAESLLILNSVVMLQDGPFHYKFSIDQARMNENVRAESQVGRRLQYLK